MNMPYDRDPTDFMPEDFDDSRQEHEWLAQERAMREERVGTDAPTEDPRVAQYRLLARALRHPPLDPVPFDFAAQVARAATTAMPSDHFETLLLRALVTLLALASIVVAVMYGAGWWPSFAPMALAVSDTVVNWGLALLACTALTWLLDQVRRASSGRPDGPL